MTVERRYVRDFCIAKPPDLVLNGGFLSRWCLSRSPDPYQRGLAATSSLRWRRIHTSKGNCACSSTYSIVIKCVPTRKCCILTKHLFSTQLVPVSLHMPGGIASQEGLRSGLRKVENVVVPTCRLTPEVSPRWQVICLLARSGVGNPRWLVNWRSSWGLPISYLRC